MENTTKLLKLHSGQWNMIVSLIAVSLLLFTMQLVIWIYRAYKRRKGDQGKVEMSTILRDSIILAFSIFFLRFAVGYFDILNATKESEVLLPWEELVNCIFKALRTFGMDEENDAYITSVRAMVPSLIKGTVWQHVAVAYAFLLNLAAPILSGAIILEILSSVVPKFKLKILNLVSCRKCFFSELNPASLALAKSIYAEHASKKKKALTLIFTDTYVDREEEKEYELLLEAKRYGAICVRDDLAHVAKPIFGAGKSEYYLMDENEFGNLQTLVALVEDHNIKHIKDAAIYLFVQSDAYVQIEKKVNKKLEEKKHLLKGGKKPKIVPIRGYRNLVHNLFVDVPLYEPLVRKTDPSCLNVTILGNGIIGTEAFLGAYWFGQFLVNKTEGAVTTLKPCELTINVVSKDTPDDFWAKIDYVNPEIRKTVEVLGEAKCDNNNSLLAWNQSGDQSATYAKVRYIQADVKIGGFWTGKAGSAQTVEPVFGADYFVVALGSDADNISIAEKLRLHIGKTHVEARGGAVGEKTVIAYAVFDSVLSSVLNEEKHVRSCDNGGVDIYMHAFGSLEQVYSCDNVWMSKNKLLAEQVGNGYRMYWQNWHQVDAQKRIGGEAENHENANYNHWADQARAMHLKYKVFSLGWIQSSIFDYQSDAECEAHYAECRKQCELYRVLSVCDDHTRLASEHQERYADIEWKKHCLAWLEHRRWNAFTRTMGYRCVSMQDMLAQRTDKSAKQKHMSLKLHACLVEARQPVLCDAQKTADDMKYLYSATSESTDFRDRLDDVSRDAGSDYKTYDYYRYEFGEFRSEADLRARLGALGKYADHTAYNDCVPCEMGDGEIVYMLSVDSVKRKLASKCCIIPNEQTVKGEVTFEKTKYATKFAVAMWKIRKRFEKPEKKNENAPAKKESEEQTHVQTESD